MIFRIVNMSKIKVSVCTIVDGITQTNVLLPNEEKEMLSNDTQIEIGLSQLYNTKLKGVNSSIVINSKYELSAANAEEYVIKIYNSEKFTEQCLFILDFVYIETNMNINSEHYAVDDPISVRESIISDIKKEKKTNKRFDYIWPFFVMAGGSTIFLSLTTSGVLFWVLLIIDYVLIYFLNKLWDKVFKIDKGIEHKMQEKINMFDTICCNDYLHNSVLTIISRKRDKGQG